MLSIEEPLERGADSWHLDNLPDFYQVSIFLVIRRNFLTIELINGLPYKHESLLREFDRL